MRALIVCAGFLAVGCGDIFGTKDPKQPGTELGMFHVAASQASNTCGQGALGAGPSWEFDVKLGRGEGELYWHNGAEVIIGQLAEDGMSFSFATAIEVDMRTEETLGMPPCSVRRDDTASGMLDSADDSVEAFSGSLSFAYAPMPDSECSDLLPPSEQPVFAALPCSMAYQIEGTRTEE